MSIRTFFIVATILSSVAAWASPDSGIGFTQKLGAKLPLQARVVNESGSPVRLGSFFQGKPVILVFAYYECPNLCTLVLNGLVQAIRNTPLSLGKQYEILTLSIDPTETPKLALAKKRTYLAEYGVSPVTEKTPWHFLTADQASIEQITQAAGFRFRYDPVSKQYLHPSGIVVLSPQGEVMQYFFGIQFDPHSLEKALLNAKRSKAGKIVDEILLFCLHYDPKASKNGTLVINGIRIAAGASALALMIWLVGLRRKEKAA